MKRRQLLLILMLLATVAWAAWLTGYLRGPRAQGRSLNQWLEEYDSALNSVPVNHQRANGAIDAIREMGPSGVRELLRRMNQRDSELKLKLIEWSRKQSLVRIQHQPAERRRQLAVAALCDLGPSAGVALPRLAVRMNDAELRYDASRVMASIGSASVPALTGLLAHANERTRFSAAQALGWIGRDAAPAVPMLLTVLQQTNRSVRSAAIRALGAVGVPKKEIEERLIRLLQQPTDALDAACGLANLGNDGLFPLTLALTNSEPRLLHASLAGLMFWHEANKRIAPTEARELRRQQQRLDVLFNLKALSAGFASRKGSADRLIARTLVMNFGLGNARLCELSAAMLARFPGGAQDSVPALKRALGDDDPVVRAAARRSLDELPDPPPPATNSLPPSVIPRPGSP